MQSGQGVTREEAAGQPGGVYYRVLQTWYRAEGWGQEFGEQLKDFSFFKQIIFNI